MLACPKFAGQAMFSNFKALNSPFLAFAAQEIYKNKTLVGLVHAFLGDLYRGVSRIISILGEQHDASNHTCSYKVFKPGGELKYCF